MVALSGSVALSHAAFVDGYGRAYATDLRARVAAATTTPDLGNWLNAGALAAVAGDAAFGRAMGLLDQVHGQVRGDTDFYQRPVF